MQLLVAPAAFKGTLRSSVVATAIGQGLEEAGLEPPDLCPLADGGEGTLEVLLGRLGGETAAARVSDSRGRPTEVGFALLDDGATALVELDPLDLSGPGYSHGLGELLLAAAQTGAGAIILAAGRRAAPDGGSAAIAAVEESGGLGGADLVVLCDARRPSVLAENLHTSCGATLRSGIQFVLQMLDFDNRMRAAWAVVAGEGRLDRSTLDGKIAAEVATRARQGGVPAHAIVGACELDRFDARILDLQEILVASTRSEIVAAGRALAGRLLAPNH